MRRSDGPDDDPSYHAYSSLSSPVESISAGGHHSSLSVLCPLSSVVRLPSVVIRPPSPASASHVALCRSRVMGYRQANRMARTSSTAGTGPAKARVAWIARLGCTGRGMSAEPSTYEALIITISPP
jgi:hypothetical protein